jgi:hypothetical protein
LRGASCVGISGGHRTDCALRYPYSPLLQHTHTRWEGARHTATRHARAHARFGGVWLVLCISTVHLRRQLRQEHDTHMHTHTHTTRACVCSCVCVCGVVGSLLALWPTALCADGAFEACLKGSQRTRTLRERKNRVRATRTKVMKSRIRDTAHDTPYISLPLYITIYILYSNIEREGERAHVAVVKHSNKRFRVRM